MSAYAVAKEASDLDDPTKVRVSYVAREISVLNMHSPASTSPQVMS